ncbi:MAG: histidinol-phosphate phosphatase family protein [Verrucomicrobia bacterium]|nr:histidinol-phosphate phosphatase family protein [Verrucomicrobiota bacterium]
MSEGSIPPFPGRSAVFLDRDGTLNRAVIREGKPYAPGSLKEFELFEGVPAACRALHAAGYVLVVATNQPDVGRGIQTQEAVEAMHAKLREWIPEIARVEVCYAPGRDGDPPDPRRKPEPGMLLDAARRLGVDLAKSWMIGDRWRDVDCGARAGVRTVLIDFHYAEPVQTAPTFTAASFADAVRIILAHPDGGKLNPSQTSLP